MHELDALEADEVKGAVEAMLFVSVDPVRPEELAEVLSGPGQAPPTERVRAALQSLAQEYERCGRGFQLREVAGGWRLFTHPAYHDVVEDLVKSWDTRRLTQASLETLAIIAYHQPATREDVRAVRGVNSDSAISSLIDKGLVREIGHREGSTSILYGTTQVFLEKYGLKSLRDLPDIEQFAPDEDTRQLIHDRLSGVRSQATIEGLDDVDGREDGLDGTDLEDCDYDTYEEEGDADGE